MANKQKAQGQYMTPSPIVTMVLDNINYSGSGIFSWRILEPSFGDGQFLLGIVERVINTAKAANLTNAEIQTILENNIFGIEKDKAYYDKAISRLNAYISQFGLIVNWRNLINADTLLIYQDYLNTFDFVVGNPPFVSSKNIPDEYRYIFPNFQFSNGMLELYIIFYEIGLYMLKSTGKLGYISPNSFMRNSSQAAFRQYLMHNYYLQALLDFRNSKIFPDADTYTCICVLNKTVPRDGMTVRYAEYDMYTAVSDSIIDYPYFMQSFDNKPWNLKPLESLQFLENNKKAKLKLGDIVTIQNTIVTNCDDVYIHSVYEDTLMIIPYKGKHTDASKTVYIRVDNKAIPIESGILHRCVKASRFEGKLENTYIIFPYKPVEVPALYLEDNTRVENEYTVLPESELSSKYPNAYAYLKSRREELANRALTPDLLWYEYGHKQGFQTVGFAKIIFKHVLAPNTSQMTPYFLEPDIIPYSGFFITIDYNHCVDLRYDASGQIIPNTYQFDSRRYADLALRICSVISSSDFDKYCRLTGKNMSGGYITTSINAIKAFGTALDSFPD